MLKQFAFFFAFMTLCMVQAQDVSLPEGLRQHALTEYNSSLFNPAFSIDRNNPQSISLWTRWQWQNIDVDPTTLFLNYTRKVGNNSAIGAGFFQQNTGIFFNTGGVINYSYEIKFNSSAKLSIGANVFGFSRELADDRFPVTSIPGLPSSTANDFILQFAPGINLSVENFSLGFTSENLIDYNITDKISNSVASDKIYMGMASYDIPVVFSDPTAFLRPSVYVRTVPNMDVQVGGNALFSTKKYWAQAGYNNFYGASVGAGGTVFNRFSLGALAEFGTSNTITDPSFEIIVSYFLGNPAERRKSVAYRAEKEDDVLVVEEDENKEEVSDKELEKQNKKEAKALAAKENEMKKEKRKDSLATVKKEKEALAIAKKQGAEQEKITKKDLKEAEAIAENDKKEQERLDSIQKSKDVEAKKAEIALVVQKQKEQKRLDSINAVNALQAEAIAFKKEVEELAKKKAAQELAAKQAEEKIEVQAGEKYQEVTNEDGLQPGFYLIANVFGTKKYFDAFMNDLRKKGIEPKSFYRSKNKYNYAYLERYNTIGEARRARDSKFNGKYQENTWIFRVK